MTDKTTPTYSTLRKGRIARDSRFDIRLSPTEREKVEAGMRQGGFNTVADYVRFRLFGKPSGTDVRDQLRVGGALFSDSQMCEIAVAVVHQYGYLRAAMERDGKGAAFEEDRQRVVDALGLRKAFGSGEG